jgi:hypothetical protein
MWTMLKDPAQKKAILASAAILAGISIVVAVALVKSVPTELSVQEARAYGPLPNRRSTNLYDIAIEFTYEKKGDAGIYCLPEIGIKSQHYVGKIIHEATGYFWAEAGPRHGTSVARISADIDNYAPTARFRLQCKDDFVSPWTIVTLPRIPDPHL